ncbi:MAG: site-2 protease family protein [Bacillota bacterium]
MFFLNLINSTSDISTMLICGLAFILVVVFSIVMHEISHGYAALFCGDATAKISGRLTLNPVEHFNWMGALMFFLVGFGWAKPVPINPNNFKEYKKGMLIVSCAGVVTNLLLAGIGLLCLYLLAPLYVRTFDNATTSVLVDFAFYLVIYGIQINFMLAMFNLLPIYPLDGYNVVNTLLPNNTKYQAFMIRYGFMVLIGLILIGNVGSSLGIAWLDIFGLFSDLIVDLINKVLFSGIINFYGIG